MGNNIKLLTMGYNPHCRSCQVITTMGTYIIVGIYEKSGTDFIKGDYYVYDLLRNDLSIKVYENNFISPYINKDIVDMAFHKAIQNYSSLIDNFIKLSGKYKNIMKG